MKNALYFFKKLLKVKNEKNFKEYGLVNEKIKIKKKDQKSEIKE